MSERSIHKQTEQGQKSAKDYFRPAKPTPSIYDSDLKRVAVYARVSTSSEEQDHQFKGRYEAEKNAVIISLEKDEREW